MRLKLRLSLLWVSSLLIGCTNGFRASSVSHGVLQGTGTTNANSPNIPNSSSSTNSSNSTNSNSDSPGAGSSNPKTFAPNFPRLAGDFIGGPQKYDSTFQTFAAKLNMVVIGGNWEGWNPGYTKEQVISSIKAQSKIGTKVFQYVCMDDQAYGGSPDYLNEVDLMHWWLYDSGTSGSVVTASNGNKYINMTAYSPKNSSGLGPYQFAAMFANDYYHTGTWGHGSTPAPDLDGFFIDNIFPYPRVSGDWLRNHTSPNLTSQSLDLAMQQGEASFPQYLHSVWPSGIELGNGGDDVAQAVDQGVTVSGLNGQFQGGDLEGAIGASWSIETWGGPAHLMKWYINSMNNLAEPKMQMFAVEHMTSDGRIPTAFSGGSPSSFTSSYQGLRYSLTAALMNDGYFYASSASGYADEASNYLWFDEYDGGGIGAGYLGQPLTSPAGAVQTGAWQNGVWKREFQNGIALWNPRGNGMQTVNLSGLGNLKHLCGKKETNVNNCKAVTDGSITIQNEDGVILLRY